MVEVYRFRVLKLLDYANNYFGVIYGGNKGQEEMKCCRQRYGHSYNLQKEMGQIRRNE